MTRTRFLSLIASLPAVRLAPALQFRNGTSEEIEPPESGFLLVTLEGKTVREELSLCIVNPDPFSSREIATGRGLAYALAPDRRALYTVSGWVTPLRDARDIEVNLQLGVTQLSGRLRKRQVSYPWRIRPLGWSVALSPDGVSLYTFIHWVHSATLVPPPVGTTQDLDASYYETFAYVFDTRIGNFLPKAVERIQNGDGREFDSSGLVAWNGSQFDVYAPNQGNVRRYQLAKDGAVASPEAVPISRPAGGPSPGTKAPLGKCGARGSTYFVHEDGLVVIGAAGSYRTARIDAAGPGRVFLTPAVSQDGKLLFVPSGPGDGDHANRIAVYETAGFEKVRQLDSQRSLGPIACNADGSRIYAILPDSASIACLNAVSLAEESLLSFGALVRGVSVVP